MFIGDYLDYLCLCAGGKKEMGEPLDMSKLKRPETWAELLQLCDDDKLGHIYGEMRHLLTTAVEYTVPCLDDEIVREFCGSYLTGSQEWHDMYGRGVEAASRQRVSDNFQKMFGVTREVRTSTVAGMLFRPRDRK